MGTPVARFSPYRHILSENETTKGAVEKQRALMTWFGLLEPSLPEAGAICWSSQYVNIVLFFLKLIRNVFLSLATEKVLTQVSSSPMT